jgi:hypothetical protein
MQKIAETYCDFQIENLIETKLIIKNIVRIPSWTQSSIFSPLAKLGNIFEQNAFCQPDNCNRSTKTNTNW